MDGLAVCRATARADHAARLSAVHEGPGRQRVLYYALALLTRAGANVCAIGGSDLPDLFPIAAEERRSFRMNFKDPNVHLTFS